MWAVSSHGLGFLGDSLPGCLIESTGLYDREGHLTVEDGVVGEADALLTTLVRRHTLRRRGED